VPSDYENNKESYDIFLDAIISAKKECVLKVLYELYDYGREDGINCNNAFYEALACACFLNVVYSNEAEK
jgi:hypothetical protein